MNTYLPRELIYLIKRKYSVSIKLFAFNLLIGLVLSGYESARLSKVKNLMMLMITMCLSVENLI